jgi:predicted DNA-binding protein
MRKDSECEVTIRMSRELRDQLEQAAQADGRSMAGLVRALVRRHVSGREAAPATHS